MVGVVRPRVIAQGVCRPVSKGPHRAPGQVTEVDHQIRRHVVDLAIELLGSVHNSVELFALWAGYGADSPGQLGAEALVLLRRDHALGLAALHVDEDAAIVATLGPDLRLTPDDVVGLEALHRLRVALDLQQPLPDQPLVDAESRPPSGARRGR